jgi:hypothetical protein
MQKWQRWQRIIFGARTRVLLAYLLLVFFSTVVSLVAIRHILLISLETEIEQSLRQEVEEFRRLVKGRNPETGELFGDDVGSNETVQNWTTLAKRAFLLSINLVLLSISSSFCLPRTKN